MNALKELIVLLLLALLSTTAFAITDADVFAYAAANYSSLFQGVPTAGQVVYQGKQFDYRYYPASGNYLAVDTSGMIYALGPVTGNVLTPVGTVASFAGTITTWQATQTGTTGGTTGLFIAAANPINLALTLDPASNAVSNTIPSIGASYMTTTGSDGTTYRLDIPDGALLQDTVITMTPVSSIANLPFGGGLGGAVKLEPEGLFFYKDVTLTIVPKVAIPLKNQVFFGFSAAGEDLILASPVRPYGTAIQLSLQHFCGGGIANGTTAERAAVLNGIANRVESRLDSKIGDALTAARQNGGSDADAIAALNDFFTDYETVIRSRTAAAMAASASCADGTTAIQTILGYERKRQILGLSPSPDQAELPNLITLKDSKCREEAIAACKAKADPSILKAYDLGVSRRHQILGAVDPNPTYTDDYYNTTCGTKEIWVGTVNTQYSGALQPKIIQISGKVTFELDHIAGDIKVFKVKSGSLLTLTVPSQPDGSCSIPAQTFSYPIPSTEGHLSISMTNNFYNGGSMTFSTFPVTEKCSASTTTMAVLMPFWFVNASGYLSAGGSSFAGSSTIPATAYNSASLTNSWSFTKQ